MKTISDLGNDQPEILTENPEISVGESVIHAGKTWVVKEVETLYLIKSGCTSQWVRRRQIKKDGN